MKKEQERKTPNTYDMVIKLFYLLFSVGALIITVSVGVMNNDWQIWLLAIFGSALGAAAYGVLAHMIVSIIRKDKPHKDKYDLISKAIYMLFYALATVAFITIGFEHRQTKVWIITFVCAYGAATIYGTIAKLIIMLVKAKKENKTK